jgi:DNA-binding transcriptional MerR regulator
MKNKTYTITELEELTDLNRRTIHYYTKEGLIPAPEGSAGGAWYTTEHILRLCLIKRMQRTHLKLSGIKEILGSLSIMEMKKLVKITENQNYSWNLRSLQGWLNEPDSPILPYSRPTQSLRHQAAKSRIQNTTKNKPLRKIDKKIVDHVPDKKPPHSIVDSSWKRYTISDGVEINIRSDILKNYRKIINSWIRQLRDVFGKNKP